MSYRAPLILTAALAATPATPASADEVGLQCLGRDPLFMLVMEGETARFDYLGDGVFDLNPPVLGPLGDFTQTDLMAAGGPVPIFIERRTCEAMGVSLPFAVEIGIPAFAGQRPATGCCTITNDE